ncbi:MAG TPA: bifunctional methylenetetrahydrofolate dehydrogenase/methenyltetrahydrofolate cyclohydrolase FolD [Solimonas sp.]|nr:bifunctional methylenetetrahydrofolate dehydrogenase/methenyltetrahydrofolate cyclohydrolase FolD [Solimonas sp.]
MSAQIIDGRDLADRTLATLRADVDARIGRGARAPALATVLVGGDPASAVYVRNKIVACQRVGIRSVPHELPSSTGQQQLLQLIDRLNADAGIDGILVQLPLPAHLDATAILQRIDPRKDVDGFHPFNVGCLAQRQPQLRPCTPLGIVRLLQHIGEPFHGRRAVVVGASNIVGRPMALELLLAGAVVTVTHRFTRSLRDDVAGAEILVVAAGKPQLIPGDWIAHGATVIDVGIHRGADGRLRGDVQFEAARERAAWITPVPGGVGPMTVAMLMQNTVTAAGLISRSP